MAKKQISGEEIIEQLEGLTFSDFFTVFQKAQEIRDNHEKEAADQKEQAEDKLFKIKQLNGNGK